MEIVIILLLIVLNGILSMSEIALVSARRSRLETEARSGSKPARAALALSGEPDRFLSTVQIGITLIGILTGLYSGEAFAADFAVVIARAEMLAPYAYGIAKTVIVIAVTYLTLIFGELVPKRIGMAMAEKVSKAVARPMKGAVACGRAVGMVAFQEHGTGDQSNRAQRERKQSDGGGD